MKFSTTFTLAALMFMSSGTDARIGGGQRELHAGHHHSHDHGHHHHSEDYYYDDYDYDSPAPAEGIHCEDPSTYNPTYTPQCINVGSGGYTCKNVRLGGVAEYRCVPPPPTPAPTAAPTPAAPVSCQDPSTYNKTFTPQCINVGTGGYTCKNVRLGGDALYQCVPPSEIITD